MKFNVTMKRTEYPSLTWYSYDTKCEKCGKIHYASKEGWVTSRFPNFTQLDLCVDCLKELVSKPVEERVNYEELKAKIFIPYDVEITDITPDEIKKMYEKSLS